MNLTELAALLEGRIAEVEAAQHAGLAAAAAHLEDAAKALVGTEDPAWPGLAESTIAFKERQGYTGRVSGTDPLLRTGQLRDSIEHRVDGLTAHIGTDDEAAAVHEDGNDHVPPRPIFGLVAEREITHAAELAAEAVMAALLGRK